MSYILDALKKAERDRHLAKIPTVQTVYRASLAPRRRLWPWIGALVVLVNAGVLIWLLRPIPMPFIESSPSSTATPAAPVPAAVSGQPAPALPADGVSGVSTPENEAGGAPPQPARASSHDAASLRVQPERKPVTTPRRVAAAPGPPVAPAPTAPKAAPQQPKPAHAPAPPTPPAAPERPVASTPAPPVPPVASAVQKPASSPAPVAPSPTKPASPGTGPLPVPQGMSPAAQEVIQKMRLQVVVYSEAPAERLVFINSHKYLEGESIDGKVVVESITPDGAVLSYQGMRFMLHAYGNATP